ncbi:MAG: hypothetical protein CMO63_06605 [Verrucomicrobiales bacterium]|nr:hypothetical protein [Verrucomicrobiales bacterium]
MTRLFAIFLFTTEIAIAGAVEYLRDIKPVLKERCYACHGALKQKAGLRVDSAANLRKGSRDGDVLALGQAVEGKLLARLLSPDVDERMPPEGAPLKAAEIAVIREWIAVGAPVPSNETAEADPREHWAFQVPRRASLPGKAANPVDDLIESRLAKRGLKGQPPAERTILIRRLYLDLLGLPPNREQLRDERPWELIVDELLASPHYGERWARHWMDIWRYSDWYGLGDEVRDSQKQLWRWRDWIVSSLNENKGYDQMIREMLAADEITPTDLSAIAATGFLARSYFKFNRTTWLDNTVEHTSKAFMGLTMNCAKCHDHKYDPIDHLDYYKFRAIFEPYQVRVDVMPGELDLMKNGISRVYDGNPDAVTYLHERGDESKADKDQKISAGPPAFFRSGWESPQEVALPLEAWRPDMRNFAQQGYLAQERAKVSEAENQLEKLKQTKAAQDKRQTPPSEIVVGESVFVDDFSKLRPKLWETTGDDWRFQDGAYSIIEPSLDKAFLRSKIKHPRDFELSLSFQTTGGKKWKSAGIRFDVDESGENSHFVYTSVGGGKVHLAHTVDGNDHYTQAVAKRPIKLNQKYTLNLKIRDTLINVALDGEFLFSFNLPRREPGLVQLLAYDAVVDFYEIEVRHLPSQVVLQKASDNPTESTVTVEAIELADAKLKHAKAEYAFARARIDADNATYRNKGNGSAETAGRRQLEAKLAQARVDLFDTKKSANAQMTIKKLEEDLEEGRFPGYEPLPLSKVSLVKTPNKDALPVEGGYPKSSTGRRTALANWLTHRDHPLTARVAVNHIWLRHFGVPLVETVSDFGLRAPKPLHHDLLDHLAVEFMESGWDMKQLHRLLLTSKTWQRSSSNLAAYKRSLAADPGNHHYWRMNSRRMEAQVVRDSLLYLGGTLDSTMGGPSVTPSPGERRRSLYFFHSRDGRSKFLSTFDDADVFACYRRGESVVPQQALAMMNSQTAIASAKQIASVFDADLSAEEFVRAAFFKILARQPADSELAECLSYLKKQPKREHFIHALINLNDFMMIR